tara:strand:- start:310 stop:471 length:162 start_codon:yes stop_codon:yes gene_type:complete
MNSTGILKNIGNLHGAVQGEIITQHPPDVHCAKCKKFKKKNTNSIYCYKCLGV